jgi:hypothetical protein
VGKLVIPLALGARDFAGSNPAYPNMYICKSCGKEFTEDYRKSIKSKYKAAAFCSEKCARSFSTKNEIKQEIYKPCKICNELVLVNKRSSIVACNKHKQNRRDSKNKRCKDCEAPIYNRNKSGYCEKCWPKHRFESEGSRLKLSIAVNERIANRAHKGWQSRNIVSYPEQFFIGVLKNNNLEKGRDYGFNYPLPKSKLGLSSCANYFLDFYFEDVKLDLEIDGKQHEYEDRIVSDKNRDTLLKDNGYTVYRIKWKNINNDDGKAYIKEEIDKFFSFYINIKTGCSAVG